MNRLACSAIKQAGTRVVALWCWLRLLLRAVRPWPVRCRCFAMRWSIGRAIPIRPWCFIAVRCRKPIQALVEPDCASGPAAMLRQANLAVQTRSGDRRRCRHRWSSGNRRAHRTEPWLVVNPPRSKPADGAVVLRAAERRDGRVGARFSRAEGNHPPPRRRRERRVGAARKRGQVAGRCRDEAARNAAGISGHGARIPKLDEQDIENGLVSVPTKV